MISQKGFAPIIIVLLVVVVLAAIGGAYYFGRVSAPQNAPPIVINSNPEPTATEGPIASASSKPAESPTSNAKVLNYKVPLGWQTVQNSTGEFQVSFNPAKYDRASAEPDELINIYGKTTTPGYTPTLYSIKIYPYDGGSRHAFIDKVMNGSSYRWEKTYEKEYLVNGKSALAVYNADASQTTLLAMMVIDSKRAFFIGGNSNENAVEELLSSLKVLK